MENTLILLIIFFSAGYLCVFFRKTNKEGHCANCPLNKVCIKVKQKTI